MPALLLLRHAIALERSEAAAQGMDDADRPLTQKGQRRMEKAASGIRRMIDRPARVFSSPLLRARQTAQILAAQYSSLPVEIHEALAPGGAHQDLLRLLGQQTADGPLVLVGHEPDLGMLIGLLLCGKPRSLVQLKKGGAALMGFERRIDAASGTLLWLMPPRQLRR